MSVKIQTVKTIAKLVVGVSTSATVTQVIKNNVNPEKLHQKIEILIGAAAIGAMVASAAEQHTDATIDQIVNAFRNRDNDTIVVPAE